MPQDSHLLQDRMRHLHSTTLSLHYDTKTEHTIYMVINIFYNSSSHRITLHYPTLHYSTKPYTNSTSPFFTMPYKSNFSSLILNSFLCRFSSSRICFNTPTTSGSSINSICCLYLSMASVSRAFCSSN